MNRLLSLTAALLLTGCSMSEEDFATKYAEEYCAYQDECGFITYFGGDVEACEAVQESTTLAYLESDVCEYDPASAADCVQGWKDLACPAEGESVEDPAACLSICGAGGA